jgi:lipopolysaccharide export system protein LptA
MRRGWLVTLAAVVCWTCQGAAQPPTAKTTPKPGAPARKPSAPAPKAVAPAPKSGVAVEKTGIPAEKSGAADKSPPVTIDADHMEAFRKESLVIFTGSVVARQNNSVQYADRMEIYLDEKGERVVRTVSTGNIRIVTRDCRTGTARRAEYYDGEQRVELIGTARVWESDNVVSGDRIIIFLDQDRSVVQGGKQERVKAVFYSRDGETPNDARGTPAGECKN